jgi:hypothetical protein
VSTAMQIQDDSTYVLDENPAALLTGAEIEAAGLYRCLRIVRLWSQSIALSQSRRDEIVEEEKRLANLYAATLFEFGCAFGIETANELKTCIEAACVLDPWECPPAEERGSTTFLRSSSDRVRTSAIAFSVSRSQKAHFKAEITRQTYRSSSGSAASTARYGSVSSPEICAFKKARYGFILSERTRSWAPSSE